MHEGYLSFFGESLSLHLFPDLSILFPCSLWINRLMTVTTYNHNPYLKVLEEEGDVSKELLHCHLFTVKYEELGEIITLLVHELELISNLFEFLFCLMHKLIHLLCELIAPV